MTAKMSRVEMRQKAYEPRGNAENSEWIAIDSHFLEIDESL